MATRALSQQRILVVDDEPLIRDSITWLLATDGHEVQTAPNGAAALAQFQKGKFALVIVDYEMPGMNGDQVAAAVKSIDPLQPILLITAYPETVVALGKPLTGVDMVIAKPFSLDQLRQALASLAALRQGSGGATGPSGRQPPHARQPTPPRAPPPARTGPV